MRIIDADALQNILLPITTALENEYGNLGGAVIGCMMHIDNAPTVDAVPVVRCRECNHYKTGVCLKIYYDGLASRYAWQERNPCDFCSYGERREGADNG